MFVADQLSLRLVPDELWALAEPLIPKFRPRPQGGGTAPLDDRAVFTAIVYVLTSGCAWRDLPPPQPRPGPLPEPAVLDELGARGELDWTSVIIDAASVRAKKGGR